MAFIYQYDLVRSGEEIFNIYDNDNMEIIENTIRDIFGGRVKEIDIESEDGTNRPYIQFKLYKSATNGELRKLGKMIKARINNCPGIQRRKQKAYFIVEEVDDENNEIHVDIVYESFAHLDDYQRKAEQYFEKIDSYSREKKNIASANIKNIIYLDVYSAVIEKDVFPSDVREGNSYSVTVHHRKRKHKAYEKGVIHKMQIEIESVPEYEFLISNHIINNYDDEIDYFDISLVKEDNDIIDRAQETLRVDIASLEGPALEKTNLEENWIFKIHNVGQALATSLAVPGETPSVYFDYGLLYARNKGTKPDNVMLPIKEEGKIFLSHIHKDHWFGICDNSIAYRAKWFTPDQQSIEFRKVCAEIIMAGGEVKTIPVGLHTYLDGKIMVSCGGNSRYDPSRVAKSRHETGMVIKVCGKKRNGEELAILVEGDQDYDYVENSFLENVDILVACHHGGKYSWTVHSALPHPRSDDSCVIYSYGINNSYGHPSRRNEHISNGWINEHDTINGDYSIDVIF